MSCHTATVAANAGTEPKDAQDGSDQSGTGFFYWIHSDYTTLYNIYIIIYIHVIYILYTYVYIYIYNYIYILGLS